jgi:predicted  nucleic acid-binding Zn-ribbon protein
VREEVRGTNNRVDLLGARMDKADAEHRDQALFQTRTLAAMNTRLDDMVLELRGLRGDVQGLDRRDDAATRERSELRERVERCERDIDDLKHRVG